MKKFVTILLALLIILGNLTYIASAKAQDNEPVTNTVYLPFVTNNYIAPTFDENKGIAMVLPYMQDLDNVGAGWYYNWTPYPQVSSDPRYIPMSRCGLWDDTFPVDYSGYVLIFNEPVNREPNGCGISPQVAAERYIAFVDRFTNVIPVVSNNGANGAPWNREFILALKAVNYPLPTIWGVHLYYDWYYTFDRWKGDLSALMHFFDWSLGFTPEIWVTEFAMTSGDPVIFKQMLDYLDTLPYVTRIAPFTNRPMYEEDWWPTDWKVELFNPDGSITPLGEVYRDH